MALNNLDLGFVFTARDLASAKFARLERRCASLDEWVTSGTSAHDKGILVQRAQRQQRLSRRTAAERASERRG